MTAAARVAPAGVAAVQIIDSGQPVPLHADEEICVARSAEKRRRDFALGRHCARTALAQLGIAEAGLLRGENGAPLWPHGLVGSITHTRGYAAALVAARRDWRAIGVDAERIGGVTGKLAPRLFNAAEADMLQALDPPAWARTATILFSAKEAWFKAWSPPGPLIFTDIHIALDDDGFTASQPGIGTARGRYAVEGDLVVTAVCVA